KFTVPSVIGQCCHATDSFTINKLNENRGIIFGGAVCKNGFSTRTNNVYIFKVTQATIHWESVKRGSISGGGLRPKERSDHAGAIINGAFTPPALVVIGGMDSNNQLLNECLLFDNVTTGQYNCKKIRLPESVAGRYLHSLTAVTISPNCVWLVIIGGYKGVGWRDIGGGIKQPKVLPITDSNRVIMIVELVCIEAGGEWTVQSVLGGNDLTSKKYQEKYDIYSKTRTWWMDQLMEYPTEKEMELERYIQLLQEKLQVAHQNKVSLQEALVEANQQAKVDDHKLAMKEKLEEVLKAQVQVHEEKQIITEENEKLRAAVAYNEVWITEIEEEKRQIEEEKRKVEDENKQAKKEKEQIDEEKRQLEEQYLIEKQITKELKTKVADNELYTAKLLKEREQWSHIKETSTIGLQFNYLIPSIDNLEYLSDVQVAKRKLFLIQGDKPQLMNWEKYGLRIGVQGDSLLPSDTVEVAVVALVGGQFQFPPNTVLVSAVYAVSLSKPLLKRLKLEIQHCVDLTGQPALSRYLKFAIAPVSTPSLPYQFSTVEGGEFKPDSWYGSIQRKKFCLVAIVGEKHLPKSSTNGDESEEEQEEQAEEGTEEEVEDGNSDSSSDSDETKDPPGTSSGAQRESNSNHGVEEEGDTGGQPLFEKGNERVEESKDYKESQHEEAIAPIPCTEISSDFNSKVVVSTGIIENMAYAGLIYYEEKRAEDLVAFTAAKDLNALLEFIDKKHSQAEVGQNILFRFKDYDGHIELKFDAPQEKPFTGWSIEPHLKPCRFLRCDVDKFGEANYPLPSTCLISVYGSPAWCCTIIALFYTTGWSG
ncbi:PREDICTED: uncharacterized protein LOC109589386, partial [Amphimedon queenslandica]|uniref:Uncharacterized protein n=1 Tax=Amphimedon queenslandica TaxID=400682 RepID=A0AAN0JVV1_AMPQE